MKFGEYLASQRQPGWEAKSIYYLHYDALKKLIKNLQFFQEQQGEDVLDTGKIKIS